MYHQFYMKARNKLSKGSADPQRAVGGPSWRVAAVSGLDVSC